MSLSDYEITDTIAQSPRIIVRRAVRKSDRGKVVIKSPLREYPGARELGQLEAEFRLLRRLDDPGVIRALALEKDGARLALVLEDFDGRPAPVSVDGLSIEALLSLAITVAKALGHVHSRQIVHKDVAPQNILMNPDTGAVKLIDFSIASELFQERQELNVGNQLEGSLPYMSPEQTGRMNRDLDYRTDYYSFGVTLFQLLTGALPFSATDLMGWVHCHISRPVPNARDVNARVPEALAEIVRRLMEKNPDDRYQSARGLLKDLEHCQNEWARSAGREVGQESAAQESAYARTIASFPLAKHDVPERFLISQKLFGREPDVAVLFEAFEASTNGPAQLLLVAGSSGVGKTALINELQRPIVAKRGTFLVGKFDRLERNVPYGALLQALRRLVRQLLAEPEDRLLTWRRELCAALGEHGQVLVDLLPEIEQVIGSQSPVQDLSPRESQNRFQRVLRNFIQAMAQPEHPLVIVLDDLQWTDAATPEILVHLLAGADVRHLLIIGAYRENEVNEGHLLATALADLRKARPDAVKAMILSPLAEASVVGLVADTLHCDTETAQPLGMLITQKTGGNPFFVNELLRRCYRNGAVSFVSEEGRWKWNRDAVDNASLSDNVVDVVIQRLRRLKAATVECLGVAACIGNRFDLQTLADVTGQTGGAIAATLREAVEERILIPLGDGYRLLPEDGSWNEADLGTLGIAYQFQHDRIQQAAYSLVVEEVRARVHLRRGQMLLEGCRESEREERIFEVVNHLNYGRYLITGLAERTELSGLNHVAALRARRSAAYAIAAGYLETSLGLLSLPEWIADEGSYFERRRVRVECLFLAGEVDRASRLCDELLRGAPDSLAGAAAFYLKAGILEHQGRLHEAVATIRSGLGLLNVELSEDHAEIDRQIGEGIGRMQAHLARTPIEEFVHLPKMTDAAKIMTMNLLFQMIPPAIQTYPPLFVLAELTMFDLALTHGVTAASCKNFVDCGIIQGGILGDYQGAYRLGRAAFALLERFAPVPLESAVHFVFGAFVSHWRAPYQESFDAFATAQRLGLEMGDIQHVAYAYVHKVHRLLAVGRGLDECQREYEAAVRYLTDINAPGQLTGIALAGRVLTKLRGTPADAADITDDEFSKQLLALGNAQWLYTYGNSQAMVSILLGNFEAAERWVAFAAPYLPAGTALFSLVDDHLVQIILLTRRWRTSSAEERVGIVENLESIQRKLRAWADSCPENFAHKYKLAAAEIARIRDAPTDEVIQLYGEAISTAGDGFVQIRALTNELQADFWIAKNQPKIAKAFLREAYSLYEHWGACAKVRQLEGRFPEWLGARSPEGASLINHTLLRDGVGGESLDLTSVMKATQAISSEVRPAKLFAKLMATIIENAGAQRGCLILESGAGGELYVEARANVEGLVHDTSGPLSIDQCAELCPEIVRYVARTMDTVVINDAGTHDRYRNDPYVQKDGVRSILCMPVLSQGKSLALLYVENNAVTHAFTPQRVRLLQMIASQAAISITNARSYDTLEEKVNERTRELAERNREVAVMLNSMEQGIFTIDEHLIIQPQYSKYLEQIVGAGDIAGKECLPILFAGSNVGPDLLDAMSTALHFSFGVPLVIAEANRSHLVQEFQRQGRLQTNGGRGEARHFEVEWNAIVDEQEDVTKMLVTLRDVTAVKKLKEIVAEQDRELDIVGQILESGVDVFERFCASARDLLAENMTILRVETSLDRAAAELVFRNMHTMKGNARLLGLSHIVDWVHRAEESCNELRQDAAGARQRQEAVAGIEQVQAVLQQHEDVCQRKLGNVHVSSGSHQNEELNNVEVLVRAATAGSLDPLEALGKIEVALARAMGTSLAEVVMDSAKMLPSLARELDKAIPIVDIPDGSSTESQEVMLSRMWVSVMRDVMVHGLRNAVDHGIETPARRRALGKPEQGRITVRFEGTKERTRIRLWDDGRGLPLDALRTATGKLQSTDEEIAETVFQSGVSTAVRVSKISGRGVGLDAARSFVRRHGGDARVLFTGDSQDGCRPFELVFDLPRDAVVSDAVGANPVVSNDGASVDAAPAHPDGSQYVHRADEPRVNDSGTTRL